MTSENTFRFDDDAARSGQEIPQETVSAVDEQMRDIAEVPAIEVITTAAVHLMSAAAVKFGLAAGEDAEERRAASRSPGPRR